MCSESARPSLRIQTVLYGHELKQLWRLLHGLKAAARHALSNGITSSVEWALGDCSPSPIMQAADVEAMADVASEWLHEATYEFFGENLGSSGGQNRLAKEGTCDLLLVLNPDTYPSPAALTELVRALANPLVGIAEARQIPLEHPRYYDPLTGETSWASGFCMLIRNSLFVELGGFDADHFLLHCDDVDLSWRARQLGSKVVTAPRAVVFHDKRPRIGDAWPAPDHELYHAALGRLLLATRWNRPDVVEQTMTMIESGASDIQKAALAEFLQRRESGRVPEPERDVEGIVQFVHGEYAVHRF